jgi:O-antigen/teichoic acid export membrane protein
LSPATRELSFGANAALNVLAWFVPALTALVAVPITVRGLGADAYGLLALVTALTGFLGLMELGLGTAIVRYLSYYRALDQGRPMLGIVRFAVVWFGAAGLIGGIVLFVGAQWFAESLLKMPADMVPTATVVIRISAFGFVTGMLVSVGSAIPQSFLRYDLTAITTIVFGVLGSAGPAVLVSLGFGLVAIVAYGVGVDVLAIAAYVVIAVHLFKSINRTAGPSWPSIRRETLRFAGVAALNQIHGVVAQQTTRIVVGAASGVAAAAYYQVPAMLASRVNSGLQRVAYVIFPTASGMYARDDREAVSALYLRTSRLFFAINASVTMAMCALAYPLLAYWVSPKYAQEGAVALAIFSVASAVNATTMAASYVNLSAERPGVNLIFSLASSVVTLAAVYPLTVHWGVTGASLAGLLGAANVPVFFWYVHKNILRLPSRRVWRDCYQRSLLANLPLGAAIYFFVAPRIDSLAAALAAFVCACMLGLLASGLLGAIKREDVRAVLLLLRIPWLSRGAAPAPVDGKDGDSL